MTSHGSWGDSPGAKEIDLSDLHGLWSASPIWEPFGSPVISSTSKEVSNNPELKLAGDESGAHLTTLRLKCKRDHPENGHQTAGPALPNSLQWLLPTFGLLLRRQRKGKTAGWPGS